MSWGRGSIIETGGRNSALCRTGRRAQRTPVQDDDAWAGWVFLASISCHDSTCSMRAPSHVSRHTPPGPRKPTQQAKGVATVTDRPKRGSLSLTEVKAVAPIHGFLFGFVFIAPITSAENRMAANTSLAHRQCPWGIDSLEPAKTAQRGLLRMDMPP
jgi:hypothetical protein